jgi:prephenate dehydrogenase
VSFLNQFHTNHNKATKKKKKKKAQKNVQLKLIDNKTAQEIKLVFYTLSDVIVLTTPAAASSQLM